MRKWLTLIMVIAIPTAFALDAEDFYELKGYTVLDVSNVEGEFNGADFDSTVSLDNGMVFRFTNYYYTYSYRPKVVVLGARFKESVVYRLIIRDRMYSVYRVR